MEKRHFGIVEARIYDRSRRVEMVARRGPAKLPDGEMRQICKWALDGVRDLKAAGYQIDTTSISGYLAGG